MEGTGRCSPARLEGAAAPLLPPCRASARCSSRADAWTFKEEQEKPSQFLVTCINRGVGKGGCSFRCRLHLCGGWAPLEHPLQSLNKARAGSTSQQWAAGSSGRLGVVPGTCPERCLCRCQGTAGVGAVPAGPFCPGQHLQPVFEDTEAEVGLLLREPSAAAGGGRWRCLAAPRSLPGLQAAPGRRQHGGAFLGASLDLGKLSQ